MKKIKLMADYHCYPLWDMSQDNYGDIDPASLPISTELKEDLIKWSEIYNNTLDLNNPKDAGFKDKENEVNFKLLGMKLAERLKRELGDEYFIITKL